MKAIQNPVTTYLSRIITNWKKIDISESKGRPLEISLPIFNIVSSFLRILQGLTLLNFKQSKIDRYLQPANYNTAVYIIISSTGDCNVIHSTNLELRLQLLQGKAFLKFYLFTSSSVKQQNIFEKEYFPVPLPRCTPIQIYNTICNHGSCFPVPSYILSLFILFLFVYMSIGI